MVKIVMDSTADLPENIIEQYDIDILPLRVSLEEKEYIDKITITVEEVYDAMRKGVHPNTSLPNPKTTYELFEKHASEGKDFIFYSFSSKLSSTYETAYLIMEELKQKYPKTKMKTLDTKGGSFASGLIAMQGALLAREGASWEEIVKTSRENIANIEHIFTINDLTWLLEGGRIDKKEELIGKVLNIKPILHVDDGKMIVIDKTRGRKRAFKKVVDLVEDRIKKFPNQIIGITHADDLTAALEVKDMIYDRIGNDNILIEKIGSVLGSHLGIGGVGIFFLNNKPETYMDNIDI